ncbi:uncharacterized protein AMSG_09727 [Thecamonas trahens ATCC 50062]|uniref:AD domain-containing protein n=1 Tax=Thecamonas trahens ATCC 50062 TaxID=461836 RepID=A0A0L0DP45_THETB|nr:hypothetical protein AMSG_09727 [Thecamonas trahens ATCC 50062]KNC54062.1 hypothetical protein AMSG_09727 [Thecamonas trahens ATCC 50062]|eukprot:XP_013754071.1 hypothetical protein AMSG_09727 [Thecamonas trahens ATCC 50062]
MRLVFVLHAYSGELFTYDARSGMVVFQDASRFPKRKLVLLREEAIASMVLLAPPPEGLADSLGALHAAHMATVHTPPETIRKRETAALRADYAEADKIGVGVSARAQAVFNVLAKTGPAKWDGEVIRIHDVTIAPPYAPDDAQGPNARSRDRIRLILNKEKAKIDAAVAAAAAASA